MEAEVKRTVLKSTIPIAGVGHAYSTEIVRNLRVGAELDLVAEPSNPFDEGAVMLLYKDTKLGYVPKRHNAGLSRLLLEDHARLKAVVTAVELDAPRPDLIVFFDIIREE